MTATCTELTHHRSGNEYMLKVLSLNFAVPFGAADPLSRYEGE